MSTARYFAYQLHIESDLPIPGLAEAPSLPSGEPDVWVRLGEPTQPHDAMEAFLEIAGVARYWTRGGREIFVAPDPGASLSEVAYCLRGSAFAALLAQRGLVPIHASAVYSKHGAILLVGAAGTGKSTLAAALVRHGYPLMSDDFTALRVDDKTGAVVVVPSGPELRLCRDTLQNMGEESWKSALPIRPNTNKFRLPVPTWSAAKGPPSPREGGGGPAGVLALGPPEGGNGWGWGNEAPVCAVFFLNEPATSAAPVELELLTQEAALERLASNIYRWRLLAAMGLPIEQIQQAFTRLVRDATHFTLKRPRDLNRLPECLDPMVVEIARLTSKKAAPHWTKQRPLPAIQFGEDTPAVLEEGRPGFVLVTSYPKSGNTWVRALLTSWRVGGKLRLSALDGLASYRRRHDFEEVLGVDSEFFRPDELILRRAQLFKQRAARFSGSAPTKLHDQCVRSTEGELLYPPEAVAGVIHIVRCPLDVAPSLAHHLQTTVTCAVDIMNDSTNKFCSDPREIDGSSISPNFPQVTGSWSDHVVSWLEEPRYRCLLVRYEDLLADTLGQLQRILEFIDIPWDAERGRRAVRDCSFKTLQREERTQGFKERPSNCPAFFRQGKAGDGQTALGPELARRLCLHHQEVMRRLGYEREVDKALALRAGR